MEWVALGLVFNLLCFCALIAWGYFRWHEGGARHLAEGKIAESRPLDDGEDADWLNRLASKVGDDIDCHSFQIEQIGIELRETTGNTPDDVLKAAARVLIANRRLQQDLNAAQKEIQQQRQEVASLAAEARTDTLTGLPNRRSFNEDLARRFDQWRRHQIPMSLIMIDVDSFKKFNDTHGHQTGDEVLRLIAQVLRKTLRQMDLAARFGGEEFAVLLPGTRLQGAMMVAERLRATAAVQPLVCGGKELHLTVSVGLASVLPTDDTEALIKRADEALYAAKNAGRNRAFVHDGTTSTLIVPDNSVVRQPFNEKQFIAAYSGQGPLPEADQFYPVQCHDLSAGGLSFLCEQPPDFQTFVVRLGKASETCYVIARVANVVEVGTPDRPGYRVGCSFLNRLGPDSPTSSSPTVPAAPIVISDPQTGLLSFSSVSPAGV
jgi:diguanylate cyclase (GGDEF)-like protein